MGGKSGGSAPSPDPNIGRAALKQAATGEQFLEYMKGQSAITNKWAEEDRGRYQSVFQPIEDTFVDKATNWDSPERQAQMAAEASADVRTNAALQRGISDRAMASLGVSPTSGRYAGVERGQNLGETLAAAGAQNNARNSVRTQGMGLLGDAVNMGKGLPSQALGAMQTSNSAASAGFGGAMQGYAGMGNTLNTQYGNQLNAWSAEQKARASGISGLTSALGTIGSVAMMASDENVKTDKRPVKGALAAVRGLPIEAWRYKPGVADGGEHIGTYAQDFRRETGMGDGRGIPVIDAIGVTMKAVQELDRKVDSVADGKRGRGRGAPKQSDDRAVPRSRGFLAGGAKGRGIPPALIVSHIGRTA